MPLADAAFDALYALYPSLKAFLVLVKRGSRFIMWGEVSADRLRTSVERRAVVFAGPEFEAVALAGPGIARGKAVAIPVKATRATNRADWNFIELL